MEPILVIVSLILTIVVLILTYCYFKMREIHSYWALRNIPHVKPKYLGSLTEVPLKGIHPAFKNLYDANKQHKFFGLWSLFKPVIMINDPDLIKAILISDFSHFHDHGAYYNELEDPLSAHLFALEGSKWRNLRVKLTPTFTSGKMKYMFPTLVKISKPFIELCEKIEKAGDTFDCKEMIARFSTDIIASCAFGIDTNCIANPNAEFREMGRKIFEPTYPVLIKNIIGFLLPDIASKLKLVITPRVVTQFFIRIMHESIAYRKQHNEKRKDFLQLLIELMDKGTIDDVDHEEKSQPKDEQKFTFNEAAAQAFVFYLGGFETSSTALQFTLYELAKNQEVQNKLRKEIQECLDNNNGEITYDGVHGIKYLSQVLEETLRMYSPAPMLSRICNSEYKIPNSDVKIEKGMYVFISAAGLHWDENYFPEPDKFNPDRFSDEEKAKRHHFVYLPFGDGPRVCIGQRFAQMQMRIALTCLLANFRFEFCDETPRVIKYDPKSIMAVPIGGMKLKITKLR